MRGGTHVNKVSFNASPNIGMKLRKKYDYRFNDIDQSDPHYLGEYPFYVITEIDKIDKILDKNHYFVDIPVSIQYQAFSKLSINAGLVGRYYFPLNREDIFYDDFFSSSFEFGLISGFGIKLSKNVVAQLNYFHSISKIYSEYVTVISNSTDSFSSSLKSRFVQIRISYNL